MGFSADKLRTSLLSNLTPMAARDMYDEACVLAAILTTKGSSETNDGQRQMLRVIAGPVAALALQLADNPAFREMLHEADSAGGTTRQNIPYTVPEGLTGAAVVDAALGLAACATAVDTSLHVTQGYTTYLVLPETHPLDVVGKLEQTAAQAAR